MKGFFITIAVAALLVVTAFGTLQYEHHGLNLSEWGPFNTAGNQTQRAPTAIAMIPAFDGDLTAQIAEGVATGLRPTVEAFNTRFDTVESRLDTVEVGLKATNERLGKVEANQVDPETLGEMILKRLREQPTRPTPKEDRVSSAAPITPPPEDENLTTVLKKQDRVMDSESEPLAEKPETVSEEDALQALELATLRVVCAGEFLQQMEGAFKLEAMTSDGIQDAIDWCRDTAGGDAKAVAVASPDTGVEPVLPPAADEVGTPENPYFPPPAAGAGAEKPTQLAADMTGGGYAGGSWNRRGTPHCPPDTTLQPEGCAKVTTLVGGSPMYDVPPDEARCTIGTTREIWVKGPHGRRKVHQTCTH